MIKGYQYQSDFARKHYGQGRAEGVRRAICEFVGARWPHLRAEVEARLEARLRDLPEERLLQIIVALDGARDEASLRALLDGRPA